MPPLLLGTALLFWGMCTHQLLIAMALALLVEFSRLSRWQWPLSDKEFFRVSDLCAILFLGSTIYAYNSYPLSELLFVLLRWMPLLLFPLLAAQYYSERQDIPLSALIMRLRRREKQTGIPARRFDFSYPFLAYCLLAASIAETTTLVFYFGLAALCAWALWPVRSRRYPRWLWASILVLAIGLGFLNQMGILHLQQKAQRLFLSWYKQLFFAKIDPYRSRTALGYIGTLKLSNDILMRVDTEASQPPPLLRDASFNRYYRKSWYAEQAPLRLLLPLRDEKTWLLYPGEKASKAVRIADYTNPLGQGLLKLPQGTQRIEQLPVSELKKNNLGTFKIEKGPGYVEYTSYYDAAIPAKQSYNSFWDLEVPQEHFPVLDEILAAQGLSSHTDPAQTLDTLYRFFQTQFRYTVILKKAKTASTPLQNFLRHNRAGHCEYFATATVLLLRRLGIPARYATGYSVQEYSPWGQNYLVRQRHAHAWALVYKDGVWQDFDTTSANWNALEEEANSSLWQPFSDFGAWLHYHFSRWRWSENDQADQNWMAWLLLPLSLLLVWRLFKQRRVERASITDNTPDKYTLPGHDSPFYAILSRLKEAELSPFPGESLLRYLQRLDTANNLWQISRLYPLLQMHYRYRFHPQGLPSEMREKLRIAAQQWLEQATK